MKAFEVRGSFYAFAAWHPTALDSRPHLLTIGGLLHLMLHARSSLPMNTHNLLPGTSWIANGRCATSIKVGRFSCVIYAFSGQTRDRDCAGPWLSCDSQSCVAIIRFLLVANMDIFLPKGITQLCVTQGHTRIYIRIYSVHLVFSSSIFAGDSSCMLR